MAKKLYMETTEIAPEKTAGEIMGLLGSAPGVRGVAQEFDGQGQVTAVTFAVEIEGARCEYRLPINTEPVFKIINGRRQSPWQQEDRDRAQATRTAWRLVLRWVQAQLAMIETEMVTTPQVFLPYMLLNDGSRRTVFDQFVEVQLKALPEPSAQ
ncbi:MAG: hypothetical protein ACPG77_17990 [Nannocystaceae bacterium]